MRKKYLIMTLFTVFSAFNTLTNTVNAADLEGFWSFDNEDGADGRNLGGDSNNTNDGHFDNGGYFVDGWKGKAFQPASENGVDPLLVEGINTFSTKAAFSLTLFVKADATPNGIMASREDLATGSGFSIAFDSGQLVARIQGETDEIIEVRSTATFNDLTQWRPVAVVYESGFFAERLHIFVDSLEVATTKKVIAFTEGSEDVDVSAALVIGARRDLSNSFNGAIDEVRFYSLMLNTVAQQCIASQGYFCLGSQGGMKGLRGSRGKPGEAGEPGVDAEPQKGVQGDTVVISDASYSEDGRLTLILSDGESIALDSTLKGKDGAPGRLIKGDKGYSPTQSDALKGDPGPQGDVAVYIESATINSENQHLILTLFNPADASRRKIDVGNVTGKKGSVADTRPYQGKDGAAGNAITKVSVTNDGQLQIEFSKIDNRKTFNIKGDTGTLKACSKISKTVYSEYTATVSCPSDKVRISGYCESSDGLYVSSPALTDSWACRISHGVDDPHTMTAHVYCCN